MIDPFLLYRRMPHCQIFTFVSAKDGTCYHFAATLMNMECQRLGWPIVTVEWQPGQPEHFILHSGVEWERVERLTEAQRDSPVLILDMEDGEHVLADGNHRAVRRVYDGFTDSPAWIVPKEFWWRYRVNMPSVRAGDPMLTRPSGL